MKSTVIFASLMFGLVGSTFLATSQAGTEPVMESHGSLKTMASLHDQALASNDSSNRLDSDHPSKKHKNKKDDKRKKDGSHEADDNDSDTNKSDRKYDDNQKDSDAETDNG